MAAAALGAALLIPSAATAQATARNRAGDIESAFDGRQVTITFSEDRGRQGHIAASLDMLDLSDAKVFVNGNPMISLNCKNGANCFAGPVRNDGMIVVSEEESRSGVRQSEYSEGAYGIVECDTESECDAFLNALKAAAAGKPAVSPQTRAAEDASIYRSKGGRPTAKKPGKEPVIDGSRIPNQIDFSKPAPPAPPPPPPPPERPLIDQLDRENLPATNPAGAPAKTSTGDTPTLSQLADELAKQPPPIYHAPSETPPLTEAFQAQAEKYGPGLFDDLAKGRIESPVDSIKSIARQWLDDLYDTMSRNTMSRALSGQSFEEFPEEFRRDYSVWEAGVKRIFDPFSVDGGFKLVESFSGLLDLWSAP